MKRFFAAVWQRIKLLGLLWPWRKKSEAEIRSRALMKHLMRDREGQQLFRTMRKQQKKGNLDMQGPEGQALMAYLLRDPKGKDLLTGMMQNRQARRAVTNLSSNRQQALQRQANPEPRPKPKPAKKKGAAAPAPEPSGLKRFLPKFGR